MDAKSYEDRLGDALETLLGRGSDTLEALAVGLNELRIAPPHGASWSAHSLAAELHRLAE